MAKRKNKVLHIDIERGWGGGQRQVLFLLKNLEKTQHFLFCRKDSRLEQESQKYHIQTIPYRNLFSLWQLQKIFSTFDIVHCHSSKSLTIGLLINFFFKTKLFYTKRVFDIHTNLFSKYKLKNVDLFVAISKFIKERLIQNSIPQKQIKLIYSSVDYIPIKKRKKTKKLCIGSIGKLSPTKNHIIILKAVKELLQKRRDFIVYIIGDGPEKNTLLQFIKINKLHKYVKLLGYKKNAIDFFSIFDIFVFPSKLEGLGTSVLDAMLYKVPVIGSSAPAIPEIIKHRKTGLLFSPYDAKELAQNITTLLNNKKLKQSIVRTAYEYVVHNFNTKKMAEQYKKLYKT